MSCQVERRTVAINGAEGEEYDIVECNGKVYLDQKVMKALGVRVYSYPAHIEVAALPKLSVSTENGKLKLVRTPGSPKFDEGSRSPRITQRTEDGKLSITAKVEDGKLTGLEGSLTYQAERITAAISFKLKNGGIEPSGEVTVDFGDLDITITGNPNDYTGTVKFERGDCKLSLEVTAGENKPTKWALAFSIAF